MKDAKKRKSIEAAPGINGAILIVATCAFAYAFCRYLHAGRDEVIRNTVAGASGGVLLAYLSGTAYLRGKLKEENQAHTGRFVFLYLCCLLSCAALYFVPATAWPFTAIFFLLYLFSNEVTGLFAGTLLLVLCSLFSAADGSVVFLYLMLGSFVIILHQGADGRAPVRSVILPAACLQAMLSLAFVLLFTNTERGLSVFAAPLLNLAVTCLLMGIALRVNRALTGEGEKDRYADINDPAFALMTAIKTKNEAEYYRAIHTAYLAERVAKALKLNAQAVKCCACYNRIGCLDDTESVWEEVEHYFREFEFPKEAYRLLREYLTMGQRGPSSPEVTCVSVCDTLVMSLQYVFHKNKDATVNYDEMIDNVFLHKAEGKELALSRMSIHDYHKMRDLLKQEKLYYDFLR